MRLVPAALVAAIAVVVAGSTLLPGRPGQPSIASDDATGAGHLIEVDAGGLTLRATGGPARVLHGEVAGLDPSAHALLVVGPQVAFDAEEKAVVRAFVAGGGRLVLVDDVGSGSDLLAALKPDAQFAGSPLLSLEYETTADFPRAYGTGAAPLFPASAAYNRPTAVLGNGTALALTHPLTWLDADRDGRPGLDESAGAFAVAVRFDIGEGSVVAMGDPSAWTRGMAAASEPLVATVLGWMSEGGRTVLVDEGHRIGRDPVGVGPVLSQDPSAPVALGAVGVAVLGVGFMTLRPRVASVEPKGELRRIAPERGIEAAALAELEDAP